MKIANEVKVGILAIVSLAVLIVGYSFLKGKKLFSSQNTYYIEYERINGLLPSNPVQINGFQVGTIEKIMMKKDTSNNIIVQVVVDGNVPVPAKAPVRIISLSLLGDKGLEIDMSHAAGAPLAKNGDNLIGLPENGLLQTAEAQLMPLKTKVEQTITTLDSTLNSLNVILASPEINSILKGVNQTVASTGKSVNKLDKILTDFKAFSETGLPKVNGILANTEQLTTDLKASSTKINSVMDNTQRLTGSLAQLPLDQTVRKINTTIETATTTLSEVTKLANQMKDEKGSLGMLLNDDSVYKNLEDLSSNLNKLIVALKDNPQDYVKLSLITINKKDKKKQTEGKSTQ